MVLVLLLLISALTDLLYRKVYNYVTAPAVLLGFSLGFITAGGKGLTNSLIGFVIGLIFFFPVFAYGGMGGGDVKLCAAIGAIKGFPFIIDSMFWSIVFGGLMAIAVMLWKGTLWRGLKNVFRFLFTLFIPWLHVVPLKKEDSIKIPYGFSIAVGTLAALIIFKISGKYFLIR